MVRLTIDEAIELGLEGRHVIDNCESIKKYIGRITDVNKRGAGHVDLITDHPTSNYFEWFKYENGILTWPENSYWMIIIDADISKSCWRCKSSCKSDEVCPFYEDSIPELTLE